MKYPTGMDLERAAGNLYEAELSGGVYKVGDRQVLSYSLDLAGDNYVTDPVFDQGLELLGEVVRRPIVEDGGLHPEYVEQEKRFQVGRVRALVNNKAAYAQYRCVEEMYRGDPFAEHELGREEAILAADHKELYAHHQLLLATRPIDIYVVGDVEPERVREQVAAVFAREGGPIEGLSVTDVSMGAGDVRTITQEEQMKQGWLVLGLRTDIPRSDPRRYGLLFFNGILGGFVHSKLFSNVREKASLAYTASSSYDANKGLILAMAGIDVSKYDQALEIMRKQIDDTILGAYTDEELESTRRALLSRYRMRLDSAGGRVFFHVGGTAEGCPESIQEALDRIEAVDRADIAAAAERVRLDTVYFLKGVL